MLVTGAGRLDRLRALPPDRPRAARGCWCCSTTPRTTCSRSTARWPSEWHFTRVESVLADCKERRPDAGGDAALQARRRLPRRRLQARAADGGEPARGRAQQRPRDARSRRRRPRPSAVERFVLVSTDKAVNPRTVMGASKALAEWIVEAAGHRHHGTRFVTVRFGNVLGSSRQRRADLPRPDRARRAGHGHPPRDDPLLHDDPGGGAAGDPGRRPRRAVGEVFVLEMGEPVRIIDLARNMIRLAGYEPERGHRDRVHRAAARARSCTRSSSTPTSAPQPTSRGADRARRARRAARPRLARGHPRPPRGAVPGGDEAGLAEAWSRWSPLRMVRPKRSPTTIERRAPAVPLPF